MCIHRNGARGRLSRQSAALRLSRIPLPPAFSIQKFNRSPACADFRNSSTSRGIVRLTYPAKSYLRSSQERFELSPLSTSETIPPPTHSPLPACPADNSPTLQSSLCRGIQIRGSSFPISTSSTRISSTRRTSKYNSIRCA